ncbi:MAG: hypothetical protein Q7S98_06755, partial [Deltaproteobacteria bacterium]|nr:hypothetical protein [Deltaproteobacteria bacterium]
MKNKIRLMITVFALLGFGCSSSNVTDLVGNKDKPTSDQDLATFLEWSGAAWDSLNTSLTTGKNLTFPLSCPGGGSMDLSGSNIVLTNCAVSSTANTF